MSLRPRYSLLTLLLLTATVAGGIKLWRGPHWAELSNSPTQEETALLELHPGVKNFIWEYDATVVRYQFVREGQGVNWLLLEGEEFQRPMLVTSPPRELVNGYPWVLPLMPGWQPIVYWVASLGAKPEEDSLYLLAEDQNIYRMPLSLSEPTEFSKAYKSLDRIIERFPFVTLNEIENEAVRNRLAEELERLQAKPATTSAAR